MMRVIVATDGSADARVAAQWLADFPLPPGTHVLLVTAVTLPPSPLDIPTVTAFKDALMAEAREGAEELVPLLKGRFTSVKTRVLTGDPREEIVQLAQDWAADLVVVGARGLGAVATALLGSVSLALARHAPCAVLVVRPHPRSLRSVAVALDGSAASDHAARFFAALPLSEALTVRLVGVVEPPPVPRTAPKAVIGALQNAIMTVTNDRRRLLAAALDRVAKRFPAQAAQELPVGVPGECLEHISSEVDLIVLGARGLGPAKRLLLGSVSERVLRHAACPVLIVHQSPAES
jgi:nucleotide-binding universal stress UspA family protein